MSPHGRADGLAPTLAVFAVLGVGLLALFAGYSWFWLVFVLGFTVVVPLVAILASDDVRNEVSDQHDRSRHVLGPRRAGSKRRGERGDDRGGTTAGASAWWDDRWMDDWWDDLSRGIGWPDPERERERDREVRQRFGVPVGTDANRADGNQADGNQADATGATTEEAAATGRGATETDVQSALADLRARYARGDVTDDQFDRELDRLLGRDDAGEEPELA